MKQRRPRKAPNAWQSSARFKQIGSESIRRWNRKRGHLPKCGARRRDGGECQEIAMANGRCYRHGGKTPRGDQWHQRQWPDKAAPNAMQKLNYKLHYSQKEAEARQRRLRLLSNAERRAHEAWQKTHKPGSAKARAADRERRRQDRAARADILRIQIQLAIENGEGVFG